MAKVVASYLEKRAMEDLMRNHSTPIDESGNVRVWHKGWNWERVAKEASERGLNKHHVIGFAQVIGLKMTEPTSVSMSKLDATELLTRLDSIEKRLDALEGAIL